MPIVIVACTERRPMLTIEQLGNDEAANVKAKRLPTLANVRRQF
jgi:hypothetical protein